MNKTQIKAKINGFKLAKEYNPKEFILLKPKVGILVVSGVSVEKYKNAIEAINKIKSANIFISNTFLEFVCEMGF